MHRRRMMALDMSLKGDAFMAVKSKTHRVIVFLLLQTILSRFYKCLLY